MPPSACGPLHAPDATHAVARLDVQVNVEDIPDTMLAGFNVSATEGGCGASTVTVVVAKPETPAPAQLNWYVVVALRGAVATLPLSGSSPVHPPEAVQVVAPVLPQVRVAAPPEETLEGFAWRVTTGAGGAGGVGETAAAE